jgi:CO/xanthine dehydrogenase FAD-binding subunit
MMSLRLIAPGYVIDVNRAAAPGIERENGVVRVGALSRHSELERSSVLAAACPILPEATGFIGNVRVRHRGTIGGSLAHADPAAELPCVALAAGAEIHTLTPTGERRHAAASFFESHFTTALAPDEVIVAIGFPVFPGGRGSAFVELTRRAGDFATVEVAAIVDLDPSGGACTDVRVVVGAIADRPVDLSEPARQLVGQAVDERSVQEVSRSVADETDPREDERASAAYRRQMVEVLVRRALARAAERARGNLED